MKKIDRATIIVLDSAGIGYMPDAEDFGDKGANTLGNIALTCGGLNLKNMEDLGLGNVDEILGVAKVQEAKGAFGKAAEKAKGKDTTTGHWEIAGVIQEKAFPTYPNGFPKETLDEIERRTGRKILCNLPYSGTKVLDDYGDEQLKTGAWIIYTSADPVLQIAAHEELISLEELYKACKIALEVCNEKSPVARVIARPYVGEKSGAFTRTSNRHDYSVLPPKESMLDRIKDKGLSVIGIGKTNDIFAGVGITENRGTNKDNLDGILKTIEALKEDSKGLIFTNLVDFDMKYGHRRDPKGYKLALEEFDNYLPQMMENMKENEILLITADHGCDPTYKGTDHTREYVPVLVYGKNMNKNVNLGTRNSFAEIAATIEELLLGETKLEGSFANKLFK
ncbi:phosphopentomutase [Cetobacterium ceti]|uniref:Phosphopentomutase n=1 Tax=Cetobacterium ceti TaxID=180163 RepID=A0A1T4KZD3_9FUSO|nr:phosphopentomutase [Cetobacterium ceti]SJZ47812.1 phosphopentomutase [Cetobacterium ceti]